LGTYCGQRKGTQCEKVPGYGMSLTLVKGTQRNVAHRHLLQYLSANLPT